MDSAPRDPARLPRSPGRGVDPVADAAFELGTLVKAGIIGPMRPDKLMRIGQTYVRWGPTPALGSAVTAIHYPDEISIIDELGSLTFAETHGRSNAIARALRDEGIGPGDGVAIMCRNHRGFVEATMACSKLGANALYLNTAFAGPQLVEVIEREKPAAIVYDEEFSELLERRGKGCARFVAWERRPGGRGGSRLGAADRGRLGSRARPTGGGRAASSSSPRARPARRRAPSASSPRGWAPLAALLSKIPRRSRETAMIAAPLFHSWGFTHFILGLPLAATTVLRRQFDPEDTLRAVAEHRARPRRRAGDDAAHPRPPEEKRRYDVSSLEVTAASGSALPGELATKWMDEFGDNLYNLYGSTEVAWATIATPEDMRAAPGTAGKPPRGTVVKLYDADGEPVGPARPAGSSSATRCSSRATPAAAARTRSTG